MGDIGRKITDFVVVGAGPAGSVCAYLLAKRGHTVALVDKSPFPREKACGDFLIGDSLRVLDKLGFRQEVEKRARHTPRFTVRYEGGRRIEFSGRFTTLRREVFDNFLYKKALAAGIQPLIGRAKHFEIQNHGEAIKLRIDDTGVVSARYLIVASGADSTFTRKSVNSHGSAANAFAFRRYIISNENLPEAIIAYHPSIQPGYGWIIPVDHDGDGFRYNVGAGWPLHDLNCSRKIDEVIATAFADIPEATSLLASAIETTRWAGAPMKCSISLAACLPAERVVAVGEAVGTTYPFTGEGVGKAMLSGMLAADALHNAVVNDDPSSLLDYREAMGRLLHIYKSFAAVERLLARPRQSLFFLNRLRRSPYLQGIVDDVFHEDASPAPLLRPWTILRSYWK